MLILQGMNFQPWKFLALFNKKIENSPFALAPKLDRKSKNWGVCQMDYF